MAFVTYDVRLGDLKLYPLEALKVRIRAPFAKPRTALGAAQAAPNKVAHDNNVIFIQNAATLAQYPQPIPNTVHYVFIDQYLKFEPHRTLLTL